MAKLKIQERQDLAPVCPHCNLRLDTLYLREVESTFGRRYIYFCPACNKVLGVSHRKGFWMG
jgi:hypothetical protein